MLYNIFKRSKWDWKHANSVIVCILGKANSSIQTNNLS